VSPSRDAQAVPAIAHVTARAPSPRVARAGMSSAAAPPDSGATYARFLASDAGGWGAPPPEGTASESDSDFRAPISGRHLDNDEDAWDSEGGSYRGSQDSGSGGSDSDDEEEEEAGDEAVSGAPGAAASAGARSLPHALVSGAGAATGEALLWDLGRVAASRRFPPAVCLTRALWRRVSQTTPAAAGCPRRSASGATGHSPATPGRRRRTQTTAVERARAAEAAETSHAAKP